MTEPFIAALFEHLLHNPDATLSLDNFRTLTGQCLPVDGQVIPFPQWGKKLVVVGAELEHKKVVYVQEYEQ